MKTFPLAFRISLGACSALEQSVECSTLACSGHINRACHRSRAHSVLARYRRLSESLPSSQLCERIVRAPSAGTLRQAGFGPVRLKIGRASLCYKKQPPHASWQWPCEVSHQQSSPLQQRRLQGSTMACPLSQSAHCACTREHRTGQHLLVTLSRQSYHLICVFLCLDHSASSFGQPS